MMGCYQKNLGPKGDITSNGTGGFWKLSNYSINGKTASLNLVPDYSFLHAEIQTVIPDSTYPSSFYRIGNDYRLFSFYNNSVTKSLTTTAITWDNIYDDKKKQDTFWYKIDDKSGFALILDVNISKGESSRLQISNVMQSTEYRPELDSVRYVYGPTDRFY